MIRSGETHTRAVESVCDATVVVVVGDLNERESNPPASHLSPRSSAFENEGRKKNPKVSSSGEANHPRSSSRVLICPFIEENSADRSYARLKEDFSPFDDSLPFISPLALGSTVVRARARAHAHAQAINYGH